MNACPPQPGLTVMQRTMSATPRSSATALGRRARGDRDPGQAAELADRGQRPVGVGRRLEVEGDRVGAGLGEGLDLAIGLGDHQVDVEGAAGVVDLVGDRGGDQRPDRDRRDEPPVHHVEVDHPGAGVDHLGDLRPELREVGREDRRRDPTLPDQTRHPLAHRNFPPRASPSDRASASSRRTSGISCPRCCSSARSSGVRRSSGIARPARSGADSTRSGSGPGAASAAATARRSRDRPPGGGTNRFGSESLIL